MKAKIFKGIFEEFAKGTQLKSYAHYTKEEQTRMYLEKIASLQKTDEGGRLNAR